MKKHFELIANELRKQFEPSQLLYTFEHIVVFLVCATASVATGLLQSHIQVAKPYVFQQAIDGCLKDVGVAQPREDNIRLAGVQWIDNVRRALKL